MSDRKSETTLPTDRERLLLSALRFAWREINAIRAQDGRPYGRWTQMPYCTEEWWDDLTELCAHAIEQVSGEPPKPWPFAWERQANGE